MKKREANSTPVTPQPQIPAEYEGREVATEVTELKAEFRQLVDRLLVEGSTFEEVILRVLKRTGPRLTMPAVQDYFRRSLMLQAQRVRYQMRAMSALKAALGNPKSDGSELAEAAFMTGFMCLGRGATEAGLKDAETARLERENQNLKQQVLKLKEKREARELELIRARTGHEQARRQKLLREIRELHATATKPDAEKQLPPETIEKIREIYGLARTQPPPALYPREGENPIGE